MMHQASQPRPRGLLPKPKASSISSDIRMCLLGSVALHTASSSGAQGSEHPHAGVDTPLQKLSPLCGWLTTLPQKQMVNAMRVLTRALFPLTITFERLLTYLTVDFTGEYFGKIFLFGDHNLEGRALSIQYGRFSVIREA